MSEHAHLSYAATAYGVQGATVGSSHTVLAEATSAAGVYVGVTRGRQANRLHIVAENMADARAQCIDAMEGDRADRGLDHATRTAQETVRGIIRNGPIRRVTEELARLDREAERAERQAERWGQTANRLTAQRADHWTESDEGTAVLRQAEGRSRTGARRGRGTPHRASRTRWRGVPRYRQGRADSEYQARDCRAVRAAQGTRRTAGCG